MGIIFSLNKHNELIASPIGLQFLLCAVETEFQHLSFQVWLLHTFWAVLFTIVSKVAVKTCKMPEWVVDKTVIILEVTKFLS